MTTIAFYILILTVAAYVVVLGLKRDVSDSSEESTFDRLAGSSAVALFWTATIVYTAFCVHSGSYEFIPAMLVLAVAITFLHRPRQTR